MTTLTIQDACNLAPAKIGEAFYQRVKARTKAFIEQGKLIYALQQKNLRTGQSVQSILTGKGSPAGSIGNARKAANLIEHLVITELLPENRFDAAVTWRVTRFANKVLGLDKGTEQIKPPEYVADIIADPNLSSAEIADELECLAEHSVTLEQHTADLKAAAEAEKQAEDLAKKQAAEDERIRKETEAELTKLKAKTEAEADEEIEESEPEIEEPTEIETEEPEPEIESPKEQPITNQKAQITNLPTVATVMESLQAVHVEALDLAPEEMKQLLNAVNELQNDLIDCLKHQAPVAA